MVDPLTSPVSIYNLYLESGVRKVETNTSINNLYVLEARQ